MSSEWSSFEDYCIWYWTFGPHLQSTSPRTPEAVNRAKWGRRKTYTNKKPTSSGLLLRLVFVVQYLRCLSFIRAKTAASRLQPVRPSTRKCSVQSGLMGCRMQWKEQKVKTKQKRICPREARSPFAASLSCTNWFVLVVGFEETPQPRNLLISVLVAHSKGPISLRFLLFSRSRASLDKKMHVQSLELMNVANYKRRSHESGFKSHRIAEQR